MMLSRVDFSVSHSTFVARQHPARGVGGAAARKQGIMPARRYEMNLRCGVPA